MLLKGLLFILINFNRIVLNKEKVYSPQIEGIFEEKKEVKSIGVKISAKSGVVRDKNSGEILFSKNAEEKMPIASITKLMSALVFLENNQGWDKEVKIIQSDHRIGGRLYVAPGEVILVKDLFYTSLVGSANNATIALARSTGLSLDEFVLKMNEKAKELEMDNTYFEEPTGLSEENVSTALDVLKLARIAFSKEEIKAALQTEEYIFNTADKEIEHTIKNTDKLLSSFLNEDDYNVLGAKTGYTDEAMYCLVLGVKNEEKNVISVILGANTSENRFQEAKSLAWWGMNQLKVYKVESL